MTKALYQTIDQIYLKCPDAVRSVKDTFKYAEFKARVESARAEFDSKTIKWKESDWGRQQEDQLDRAESVVRNLDIVIEQIEQAHATLLDLAKNAPEGVFSGAH